MNHALIRVWRTNSLWKSESCSKKGSVYTEEMFSVLCYLLSQPEQNKNEKAAMILMISRLITAIQQNNSISGGDMELYRE